MIDDHYTEIDMDRECIEFDKETVCIKISQVQMTVQAIRPIVVRDEFAVLLGDHKETYLMWVGPCPDEAFQAACRLSDGLGGKIEIVHESMRSVPF